MKLWGGIRPAHLEAAVDFGPQHQDRPTVLDLRRPEAETATASGEVLEKPHQQPADPVRLVVVLGRALVSDDLIRKGTINVGRDASQDIVLDHPSVSREHCQIRFEDPEYAVYDMGTANGMTVNGRATAAERLADGDEIGVGRYVILFRPARHHLRRIDYRLGHIADTNEVLHSERMTQHLSHQQIAEMRQSVWEERSPHLRVIGNSRLVGRRYVLRSRTVLGRNHSADVPLFGWLISRRHAEIWRDPTSYTIRATGRWRAVYVNGAPVKGEQRLDNRDMIAIGHNIFQFSA